VELYVHHYEADEQRDLEKYVEGKGVLYPRAGTLGGCTAHNAMITVVPHDSDWEHVADLTGDESWRAKNMWQYFPARDLFIFALPGDSHGYFPGYSVLIEAKRSSLTWAIIKGHPNNTAGTVRLESKAPRHTPKIDFHYFEESNDTAGDDHVAILECPRDHPRTAGQRRGPWAVDSRQRVGPSRLVQLQDGQARRPRRDGRRPLPRHRRRLGLPTHPRLLHRHAD
jgi:choline dehydrogenase-like flavoprotein